MCFGYFHIVFNGDLLQIKKRVSTHVALENTSKDCMATVLKNCHPFPYQFIHPKSALSAKI